MKAKQLLYMLNITHLPPSKLSIIVRKPAKADLKAFQVKVNTKVFLALKNSQIATILLCTLFYVTLCATTVLGIKAKISGFGLTLLACLL